MEAGLGGTILARKQTFVIHSAYSYYHIYAMYDIPIVPFCHFRSKSMYLDMALCVAMAMEQQEVDCFCSSSYW